MTIAIVGLGGMGCVHTNDLLAWEEGEIQVVAGVDTDPARRQSYAGTYGIPTHEHIRDCGQVDAVIVCTPHNQHAQNAIDSIGLGQHVLIEKPLAHTLESAAEIQRVWMGRDLPLLCGTCQHRRADPRWRAMRRLYQEGAIGELREVRLKCLHRQLEIYSDPTNWRAQKAVSGGGILIDTGNHIVDALFWIIGALPQEVDATIERFGCEVDILTSVACQWPSGAIGQMVFDAGYEKPDSYELLELIGTKGTLIYENGEFHGCLVAAPFQSHSPACGLSPVRNFVCAIRGDEPLLAPIDLMVPRFVDMVYRVAGEK